MVLKNNHFCIFFPVKKLVSELYGKNKETASKRLGYDSIPFNHTF